MEFDYGFPSGLELYGANLELDLFDFEVRGDLNISTHHLIFPTQAGRRYNSAKRAYSLTGKRLFSRFDLGWEFFRVPAGYRTSFTYFDEFVPALKEFELVDDNDHEWHYNHADEAKGPVSFTDLVTLAQQHVRPQAGPQRAKCCRTAQPA